MTPNVPDIQVVPPEDEHIRHVIDTLAMFVLDDGCSFEQAIMERGRGNAMFDFLFDLGSPEHTYYIWRLYSFAQVSTPEQISPTGRILEGQGTCPCLWASS